MLAASVPLWLDLQTGTVEGGKAGFWLPTVVVRCSEKGLRGSDSVWLWEYVAVVGHPSAGQDAQSVAKMGPGKQRGPAS